MIPVNSTRLAEALERSPSYVSAMKAAGYVFTHGNRTLVSDALEWLKANPDFRSTTYCRHGAGSLALHSHRKHLEAATVGTFYE